MSLKNLLTSAALSAGLALACGGEEPVDNPVTRAPMAYLHGPIQYGIRSEADPSQSKMESREIVVGVFTKKDFMLDMCDSARAEEFLFDMGDGTYSSECRFVHRYEKPGTYHFVAKVGNQEYSIKEIPKSTTPRNGQKLPMRIIAEDEERNISEISGDYVPEERTAIVIKGK